MPEAERLQYVISVARKQPVTAYLRHFRLSKAACTRVDNMNRTRPVRDRFDTSEQYEYGVWGADLCMLDPQLFDAPASQEYILRMFIAMRWVVQAGAKLSADQRARAFHGFGVDPTLHVKQPGDVSDADL